ncbi:MAG: pirin family protein [Candidatus Saccharimonadales bacterium]
MKQLPDRIILAPEDHYTLTAKEFGMEGLIAIESVGPFTHIQYVGPIITVHDSVIYAGQGIGHHPHRYNERLFYSEKGTFDHDDALNGIKGHIPEGAMARFTEGQRGMIHKEWNNGDVDSELFILVATTDPVPEDTSFEVLEQKDMPITKEAPGVSTRHMVGGDAPLPIHCDIRSFNDTSFDANTTLNWTIPAGEGGLLSVREGVITLDDEKLVRKSTAIFPPLDVERTIKLIAPDTARIIRTTFGAGLGLLTR